MSDSPGESLIRAAASQDFARARSLLAAGVEFRALTPMKLFEADGSEETLRILEEWYSPVDAVEALESDMVGGRPSVRYRIRWSSEDEGAFVFEQQAYYDVSDGLISRIHIVCSGDRPIET